MISEIERNISDFITRLQNVSERFSLMVDHNEVIDAALPIFTKIDKLVSMLELLPENDDGSELATPTPPKPKTRRGRKRKAAQKSDVAEEEEISPEQALRMIKTEPGSMLEGQVDMECQSIDEGNVKFDAQDPDGDYGEHDDDDDDVVEHDEVEHDDEIDHDDDGDEGDAGDDTATDGLNLDDLASKSAAEAVKQLKFPRLKTIKKARRESNVIHSCELCSSTFSRFYNLTRHIRMTHNKGSQDDENKPKYDCDLEGCDKSYTTPYQLKMHKMRHAGEHKFCCVTCGAKFMRKVMFDSHIAKHAGIKAHSCGTCGKRFYLRQTMVEHKKTCRVFNRDHQCLTCGRFFKTERYMREHQVIHSDAEFICDYCGATYKCKSTLFSHKKRKHADMMMMNK